MQSNAQAINIEQPAVNPRKKKESSEVIIVIRDGKVICFDQKTKVTGLEGMYGDGI